ncbi:39S ribosomal protein L55, mitochondrial [Pseudolycoriella hygida]|uniref:39S ribosomal protein L55, mitochondrial n=1 Tax=Pseudolycoriella hygida TaxID=35572 RepID=A0A9Q0RZ11_9DIPT|nr:39S ribosomal protein L55, mitochondrial [Pseudolycoriella hygida]
MFFKILKLKPLINPTTIQSCKISSTSASITKVHRKTYARTYPTIVVLPNGSSINSRYHEPRQIIKLPLDLSTLTDAQRKARLEKRKPKQKIIVHEEVDDTFNSNRYINLIKK